jgi:hypothetical protein
MKILYKTLSPLREIILTSSDNILTQDMLSLSDAVYIIKEVFNLNGEKITIPDNCTLYFKGGALSNGTIEGKSTFIDAMRYQIFDIVEGRELKLIGSFRNSSFSAHWFGAKGDGENDDSSAINHALGNSCKCTIGLDKLDYHINSSIKFNTHGLSLKCSGTISTDRDITLIEITSQNNKIDINELKFNYTGPGQDDNKQFLGSAVVLSNDVFHCSINVDFINRIKNGFSLVPCLEDGQLLAGCQYNKFTFQEIIAKNCIYINLLKGNEKFNGKGLRVNENQFSGGRLRGGYGVYVERLDPQKGDPQFDWINGNVFNCLGFEDIETPVYLYHASMNSFNEIRMSESIKSETFIDLLDCNNLIFNIKSFIEYRRVRAEKSCQITLSRLLVNSGYTMGFDRMALSTSGFPLVNEMKESINDFRYIHRSECPLNMLKKFYFDPTNLPACPVNFNDLFATTWDGKMIFSNLCEISVYGDNVDVIIDFKDSIYKLRPEMIIRYELYGNSKISFYKDYVLDIKNGDAPFAEIDERGSYKVTTNEPLDILIIPIFKDICQN